MYPAFVSYRTLQSKNMNLLLHEPPKIQIGTYCDDDRRLHEKHAVCFLLSLSINKVVQTFMSTKKHICTSFSFSHNIGRVVKGNLGMTPHAIKS